MTPLQHPDKKSLIRYFRGESTHEERELIELYLAAELDTAFVERCLIEAQDGLQDDPHTGLHQTKLDGAWEKFQSRIYQTVQYKARPLYRKYARVAAVAAFLCIGFLTFYLAQHNSQKQNPSVEIASWKIIEAPKGQFKKVTLPDSSSITLFPGSSIKYPPSYNLKDRSFALMGKAYFEVEHNPEKPFFVYSGEVATRVLGTAFEVDAPAGTNRKRITLRSGKVSVSYGAKQLGLLTPDQQMTISSATDYNISKINAAKHTSWVLEQLSYDQAPLTEICAELEAWYNMSITISKPALKNIKLTATFKKQSFTTVMDILSGTGSFKYSIDNKQVVIY